MSIDFPTSLDTLTDPSGTQKVSSDGVDHAQLHTDENSAIEALQAKLGIDGSSDNTTVDFKLSSISDGDKAVSNAGSQTIAGTKTFSDGVTINGTLTTTSPDLTTPEVTTAIHDSNGNEIVETPATGSAVNHLKITNQAAGSDPVLEAVGDDTNVGLQIKGKGTGQVQLGDANLSFPDSDGTAGQVMETDGSGNLSFVGQSSVNVESSSGTSHSLTTDGSTTVVVFAKGTLDVDINDENTTLNVGLDYGGTEKDSVDVKVEGTVDMEIPFSLMYTETPPDQTASITIDGASNGVTDGQIIVFKI